MLKILMPFKVIGEELEEPELSMIAPLLLLPMTIKPLVRTVPLELRARPVEPL